MSLIEPVSADADLAVRVRGLRKAYGSTQAADGVDLDVVRGECFGLLGPNGAGKTTTVEILEGYRSRDAGEVAVLDADPEHGNLLWKARIGIVLQSAKDLDDLSVKECLNHFASYYPAPRNVGETIEAVGLSAKADTRAGKLSGGQRRRLDVALGIIGRPELLFLDEPTTGFDPEARREFWDLIHLLKSEHTTILLTTHYLEEAEVLADRVAIISAGRVIACDAPDRVGGRAAGNAIVTWYEDGQARSEATAEPTALVRQLSARFPGEIPELAVHRPSLEDVYLHLIERNGL